MNVTDPIRRFARINPGASAVIRADHSKVSFQDFDRLIDAAARYLAGLGLGGSGTLTLGAGGLVMTNYYPFTVATLSAPVVLGASQVWSVGTNGTLNLSGGLNLGGMVLTLSIIIM